MSAPTLTRCASCQAPAFWTKTASGKKMLMDAAPTATGGFVLELTGEKPLVLHVPLLPGDQRRRYTSHFATCPDANLWRRI